MQRMVRGIALATVMALSAGLFGVAKQLIVSKEGLGAYRSVQAALNQAQSGDTVLVNPGVYEETVEFKNGVTVIGSGAEHTIIRYGYGFDEVLHAQNIVSGRIERVTLERMASVLDAPVVLLESAALTFSECVITGGRPEGVRVVGLSARAVFEACDVAGNEVNGILCEAGAVVRIVGGTVRDNGVAGVVGIDSTLEVTGTSFGGNGHAAIVLEGSARAGLNAATIGSHAAWGVDASDGVVLELTDCRFIDNVSGGLRLRGSATARVVGSVFVGGEVGVDAGGLTAAAILGGTIREAAAAGLRASESATVYAERVEIVDCTGDGCELASSRSADVRYATIVGNAGDGVVATGSAVSVTNSIITLNGGAGLRVAQDPSTASPPRFGYNAVWANGGGDYVGTSRRSSDLSAYPGFVDPGSEDFSLRLESPCVGSGERRTTIGAHADPTRASGTDVVVTVRGGDGLWGLDIAGEVRLTSESPFLAEARLRAGRRWERVGVSLESSFLGAGREWLRVDGTIRPVDVAIDGEAGVRTTLRATVGATQTFDGIGSRSSIWSDAAFTSGASSLHARLDWDRTTGVSHQEMELGLGPFELAAESTDFTLNVLDAAVALELSRPLGALTGTVGLAMLPEARVSIESQWRTDQWSLGARLRAYTANMTSSELLLTWADLVYGTRIDVAVDVEDAIVRDVALTAGIRFADLALATEVGVNPAVGVRLRVTIELDTEGWFAPTVNLPPVPALDVGTLEPEAGEPITFDASASSDADGEIVEIWWDFGDGEVALGEQVSHRYERPGTYEVVLIVADDNGATATLVRPIAVLEAASTPVASFTWGPVSEAGTELMRPLRAGDLVRLDASSSYDPDGAVVEYAWDFQSDGVFDRLIDGPLVTIDPLAAGTWPVTLRVADDAGHTDAIMRVLLIEEPKPPLAGFDASPSAPSIFDPVRFIDRSAGVDGPIVAWEWSFGDGHGSREAEPVHRYEEVGRYEIRLTVTDSLGRSGVQTASLVVERSPGVVPVAGVWALVVGISDYEEVEDLPYARRDAEAVAAWMLGNGVPPERIRLLTDDGTAISQTGLDSAPATLVNVREGLGWLRRGASVDDLVVIHFSGHGYQGADDGADEIDGVDEFFILHDTRAAAKDDTALRDDEFGRFLDRIASNHVLVFFDSCYSGGLSRSLPPGRRAAGDDQDWFGDLRLEGRLLLAASSEGEEAFESDDLEHGVFTHFLLEGLGGEADLNGDYHVTVWELYEYVAARVPAFVATERGEPQHPQLLGEGETRIVLSLRDRPLEAAFSYCPPVPYAGGPVLFVDETSGVGIARRTWSFGDGGTDEGDQAEHVYLEDGSYIVTLLASDAEGNVAEARLDVPVSAAGRVVGLDETGETVVISVGSRSGVRVGDRFTVDREAVDEAGVPPLLEVIERIDEDRAACRVIEGALPHLDDRVLPVDAVPCKSEDEL